jgi:hypothetical protein
MKTWIRFLVVTIILLAGLVACDRGGSSNPSQNPEVARKATALMEALKAGDLDTALAQYDKGFFKMRSAADWRQRLQAISDERGPLHKYVLRRSQADTRFSGKFYILEYEGFYDGNKRVNHILTLVRPVGKDEVQLVGHKLKPWQEE